MLVNRLKKVCLKLGKATNACTKREGKLFESMPLVRNQKKVGHVVNLDEQGRLQKAIFPVPVKGQGRFML